MTRSQLLTFNKTLLRNENRCMNMAPAAPNIIALGLAWMSIGIAEAALEALIGHARNRIVPSTGNSVGELQWVQFDAADAHVQLLSAKLLAEGCGSVAGPATCGLRPFSGTSGTHRPARSWHSQWNCAATSSARVC